MNPARRIPSIDRGERVAFEFEGASVEAFAGESVSAALLAAGMLSSYATAAGNGRSYFCGMGTYWECVVAVEDVGNVRGCRTRVEAGLRVRRAGR
ncbi:MAG: (2Fe-2S)-binding protein, partial [Acetobacteraceae bacterium]|nr:(2Fe-2S)-binding protein [Acetobacteraceae bacterium]